MKAVMNTKIMKVGFAALALSALVGCGNKPVATLPPVTPSTTPQYGSASCGAVTGGQINSYYTNLINTTQQGGSIPASLNLTFNPNGGTQVIGPQPGQQAQVSGCFNWADLPLYFGGNMGGFGQQQTNINTAIPLTSQGIVTIQSGQNEAYVTNMILTGQTSLPAWGSASAASQITLVVQQAVLAYGGRMYVTQPAQIYINGQRTMPTGQPAPAYVTPQQ